MTGVFNENYTVGMSIFNSIETYYTGTHLDKISINCLFFSS